MNNKTKVRSISPEHIDHLPPHGNVVVASAASTDQRIEQSGQGLLVCIKMAVGKGLCCPTRFCHTPITNLSRMTTHH